MNEDQDAEEANGDVIKQNLIPKVDIDPDIEVEYVEKDEYLLTGKYYDEFKHVFQHFATPKQPLILAQPQKEEDQEEEQPQEEKKEEEKPLSRKKLKQLKRLRVAQLKALVKRPDVVEVWDTTAKDPLLLVYLKSYKNTVPVPRHWSQKRKFLQNKRGILKPPFKLPENIERTGIARLRDPFNDREAGRLVRQKLRERMNPKMGKIDIDYEVLHDAFFKYQTKPKMTIHGDIYYEGKEDEVKMKQFRPGKISDELRHALGISENAPPPWLINMQRYGPPPSYPHLKIPGLNAPMPDGSGYGYLSKALDDQGRPLLSTLYALRNKQFEEETQPVDKSLWGELIEVPEEEIFEPEYTETMEPRTESEIRSGISSVISGMETPDIDLQKKNASKVASQPVQNINYNPNDSTRPLYQVLEPVSKPIGGGIYGTTHGYIIPGVNDQKEGEKK